MVVEVAGGGDVGASVTVGSAISVARDGRGAVGAGLGVAPGALVLPHATASAARRMRATRTGFALFPQVVAKAAHVIFTSVVGLMTCFYPPPPLIM